LLLFALSIKKNPFANNLFEFQTTEDKMERLRELFSKFDVETQIHSVHKLILNLRNDKEIIRIVFGDNKPSKNPNPELEKPLGALKVHTMAVLNYVLTSEVFVSQVSDSFGKLNMLSEKILTMINSRS
jgi:hypothetical protein